MTRDALISSNCNKHVVLFICVRVEHVCVCVCVCVQDCFIVCGMAVLVLDSTDGPDT